jgi:hypothetical protein
MALPSSSLCVLPVLRGTPSGAFSNFFINKDHFLFIFIISLPFGEDTWLKFAPSLGNLDISLLCKCLLVISLGIL